MVYLDGLDLDPSSVGLEAGTRTQYLTYGLQSAGFEVVCMEARQVKAALSAMRSKTDKNDARGIAQLLGFEGDLRHSTGLIFLGL